MLAVASMHSCKLAYLEQAAVEEGKVTSGRITCDKVTYGNAICGTGRL